MEDPPERGVSEAAPSAETLASSRSLVSYFREVVPLLLSGSEGELSHMLSLEESEKSLAKYAHPSFEKFVTVLQIHR